jgi:hypothetical protein
VSFTTIDRQDAARRFWNIVRPYWSKKLAPLLNINRPGLDGECFLLVEPDTTEMGSDVARLYAPRRAARATRAEIEECIPDPVARAELGDPVGVGMVRLCIIIDGKKLCWCDVPRFEIDYSEPSS